MTAGGETRVVRATDVTFDLQVLAARRPVVVHFWAPWCAPCIALGVEFERLAPYFDDRLKLVKVNLAENPRLAARYDIQNVPTLMFFRDGQARRAVPPSALAGQALERALELHARGGSEDVSTTRD